MSREVENNIWCLSFFFYFIPFCFPLNNQFQVTLPLSFFVCFCVNDGRHDKRCYFKLSGLNDFSCTECIGSKERKLAR